MSQTFKVVDVPVIAGGRTAEPNPFEPAAKAAVQAQEQGKAIAFPLDLTGYTDITTVKEVDGVETKTTKTAAEQAEAYVVRKIRELGKPMDRTFTVIVSAPDEKGERTVTVAAKERITRAKKTPEQAPVVEPTA